jgi:hypothetical protein
MLCAKELALAILTDEFPVLLVGITALADTAGTFALLIRDGRGRTRVCVEAVLLMGREGGRRGRAVHRVVCGHVLMDRRRKQRHGSQGKARPVRGFSQPQLHPQRVARECGLNCKIKQPGFPSLGDSALGRLC